MTLILPDAARSISVNIHPWSNESLRAELEGNAAWISATVSQQWTTVNRALYFPFYLGSAITVTKVFWANGTAVAGNLDVGIYDLGGTRLVSSGSTAQATVSVVQVVDVTDTILQPGTYFMAMASNTSGATQHVFSISPSATVLMPAAGVRMQDTAFPLPATATPVVAALVTPLIPVFGLSRKITI